MRLSKAWSGAWDPFIAALRFSYISYHFDLKDEKKAVRRHGNNPHKQKWISEMRKGALKTLEN